MGSGELVWHRSINKEVMAMLGMEYDRNVWKKTFVVRIEEYGRRINVSCHKRTIISESDVCCVSSVVECGLFLESESACVLLVCVVGLMDVVLFV